MASEDEISPEVLAMLGQFSPEMIGNEAERHLAELSLYEFLQGAWPYIDPAPFMGNWHLEFIAEHLEAVSRGEIKRLLINVPPRSSKSSLVSVAYPAWTWAQQAIGPLSGPKVQFLFASYAQSLSVRDSVKMRRLVESPWYKRLWGDRFHLVGDQNTKIRFENDKGGYRISASVGSAVTGEGASVIVCLPRDVKVQTENGSEAIGDVVERRETFSVLGYDHVSGHPRWQTIEAYEENGVREILTIDLGSRHLRCTADHPVYLVGRGYISADQVQKGDTVLCLPSLWESEKSIPENMQPQMRICLEGCGEERKEHKALFGLWNTDLSYSIALGPVERGTLLQPQMPWDRPDRAWQRDVEWRQGEPDLRSLYRDVSSQSQVKEEVLLTEMSIPTFLGWSSDTEQDMRLVWSGIQATHGFQSILFEGMRIESPCNEYAWKAEWSLCPWSGTEEIWQRLDAQQEESDTRQRRTRMPTVWSIRDGARAEFACPSHRLQQEQHGLEQSDIPVSPMSRPNARGRIVEIGVEEATVRSVRREKSEPTYNVRVVPDHNYFANGVLVHNCDDLHNAAEAESDLVRQSTLSWWAESLSTRLNQPSEGAYIVIMQRLHDCLLPGTMVRVPDGERPIESLRVGDTVFGSDGWQKIVAAGSRGYNGVAYGVRLFGHGTTCWTTDNHQYLTHRGWVRADSLLKDDWVRFPIVESDPNQEIPWEDFSIAPPPCAPSGTFTGGRKRSIDKDILQSLLGEGITNTEIAKRLDVHRNTVQCYTHSYGLSRISDRNAMFGKGHLHDPGFWRVVGYWLAEGSFITGRGKICGLNFTFSRDEQDFIDDIKEVMSRYGVTVTQRDEPSVYVAQLFCSQLGRWLETHFGRNSHGKKLPEFVFALPLGCRSQLLEGWLLGDGCIRKSSGQRSGTSVSTALIHGFQRVTLSLGLISGVAGHDTIQKEIIIDGRKAISSGKARELRLGTHAISPQRARSKIKDGAAWYQIKKIEQKPYDGKVYDITTPSHDFVVGNATIHNSDVAGYILSNSNEDWCHINLPMRFDETRRCVTVLGEDIREYDGELLWPERFGEKQVSELERNLGPYAASGQLQQQPSPRGGGIFKREWWQPWPPDGYPDADPSKPMNYPPFEFVVAALDTAYTEKEENDPSALTIWGVWRAGGQVNLSPLISADPNGVYRLPDDQRAKIMLIYGWQKRLMTHGPDEPSDLKFVVGDRCYSCGEPEGYVHKPLCLAYRDLRKSNWGVVEWVIDSCRRYKVDVLLIEAKATGHTVAQELARLYSGEDFSVQLVNPRGDKVARAYQVQHLFSNHQVYALMDGEGRPMKTWTEEIITQMSSFPKAKHDDLTDTATAALQWLRENGFALRSNEADHNFQEDLKYSRSSKPLYDL